MSSKLKNNNKNFDVKNLIELENPNLEFGGH